MNNTIINYKIMGNCCNCNSKIIDIDFSGYGYTKLSAKRMLLYKIKGMNKISKNNYTIEKHKEYGKNKEYIVTNNCKGELIYNKKNGIYRCYLKNIIYFDTDEKSKINSIISEKYMACYTMRELRGQNNNEYQPVDFLKLEYIYYNSENMWDNNFSSICYYKGNSIKEYDYNLIINGVKHKITYKLIHTYSLLSELDDIWCIYIE